MRQREIDIAGHAVFEREVPKFTLDFGKILLHIPATRSAFSSFSEAIASDSGALILRKHRSLNKSTRLSPENVRPKPARRITVKNNETGERHKLELIRFPFPARKYVLRKVP
jgi:hypothetical protein